EVDLQELVGLGLQEELGRATRSEAVVISRSTIELFSDLVLIVVGVGFYESAMNRAVHAGDFYVCLHCISLWLWQDVPYLLLLYYCITRDRGCKRARSLASNN